MNSSKKSANRPINCGFISLSLDHSLIAGEIIIHCTFCEEKFKRFWEYRSHISVQHYPEINLEESNVNVKEEDLIFRANEKTQNVNALVKSDDSTFESTHRLLSKKDTDIVEVDALLHDSASDKSYNDLIIGANNFNINGNEILQKRLNQCPHCERKFYLLSSLRCHLIKHSNGYNYICNLCNLDFEHRLALVTHMRKHKKGKENKNCSNSKQINFNKLFKNCKSTTKLCNSNLKASKLAIETSTTDKTSTTSSTHNNEENLNVEGKNTLEKETLKKHTDILSSAKNNQSEKDENIVSILQQENLQNTKFHHCPICNKALNKQKARFQATYNAHMRRHTACQFKCSMCSKEFKTKGELQTHTRFHTGERPYLCSLCGESFFTASKLCNHSRRHHTKERKKKCNICKKEFYVLGELKTHIRTVHTNDRPYSCKLCPSTFNRRFSLRTHMKAHENKREHKCDFCSASFNQKCNLTAHKKKIHFLVTDNNEKGV